MKPVPTFVGSGLRPSGTESPVRTRAATAYLVVLLASLVSAQAQNYTLHWFTIDGGGSTITGGIYAVSGTIGQPDAGRLTGGSYVLDGGFWGAVAAVQTPGAPRLSVELTNSVVRVYWPLPATDWVLEQTNRITGSPGPWSQVSFPYLTNDTQIYITVQPSVEHRFYRLRKP